MSILDAEQSARYIDSLTASVQALEADLAATRDRLRQAEVECAELAGRGARQALTILQRQDSWRDMKNQLEEAQARIAALEADLTATRDRLRQAEARISEVEHWWKVGNHQASNDIAALAQAQARIAALEQRIRDLPNPIGAVTSGANPQKGGGMSPPLWHCTCQWCQARWSFTSWKRDALMTHPENGCLWAEMHHAQADARGREEER